MALLSRWRLCYTKYNYYSKPRLPGAITDVPDYVVSSGVAVDNEGKTWIVNRNEANGKSLFRLDNDTTGTPFDNQFNSSWGCFHGIVIDQNDTKWMGSTVPWHMDPGNGLFFFNEIQPYQALRPRAAGEISRICQTISPFSKARS